MKAFSIQKEPWKLLGTAVLAACCVFIAWPVFDTKHLSARSFAYSEPPAPLSTWTAFARTIRLAMHPTHTAALPASIGGATGLISTYYIGLVVSAGILLVSFLALFVTFLALCCSACPACRISRNARRNIQAPPTKLKKVLSIVLLVIYFVFALISVVGYSLGTMYALPALQTTSDGVIGALNSSMALVDKVIPVFGTVVDSMKATVTTSLALAVAAVDFSVLTTSVFPPMIAMANGMNETQVNMTKILALTDTVSTNEAVLVSESSVCQTSTQLLMLAIANISALMVALSVSRPVSTGTGTWKLTSAAPVVTLSASSIQAAAQQVPNMTTIFSPMRNSPNLTAFSVNIRDVTTNSRVNAENTMKNSSDCKNKFNVSHSLKCYSSTGPSKNFHKLII